MATRNFAINRDFVAFRQGEFVSYSVNESSGEFILNEDSDFTKATLVEIAEANDLQINLSLKKTEFHNELLNQLSNKEIPTMDQKPQTELVKEIVQQGSESGMSDDDMLIKIVEAGIKFSAAMKMFRDAQQSLGLRLTAKNRREFVADILGDDFAPTSIDELNVAIAKVATHDAISEAQARGSVRKYLRDHERETPAAAKAAVSGGIRGKVLDFLVENPSATSGELQSFISDNQPDEDKAKKLARWSTNYLVLANRLATSLES